MLRISTGLDSRMTAEPFKSTSQLKLELLASVRSHWSHHKHCKVTWHPDATRPSQSLLDKNCICPCGKHFCCCQVSHQSNGNTVFTDKLPAAIWRHRREQFPIISGGLRRLGGRGQVKIRAPSRHISTSISPWGACSFTAECLFSLRLSVFTGTLLPGYFYLICASSMLKFGPSRCTSPAQSSSLVRICWVIGIASVEKTVLPHFLNGAERIPTSGEISQHNTRFEQTEQLKTW